MAEINDFIRGYERFNSRRRSAPLVDHDLIYMYIGLFISYCNYCNTLSGGKCLFVIWLQLPSPFWKFSPRLEKSYKTNKFFWCRVFIIILINFNMHKLQVPNAFSSQSMHKYLNVSLNSIPNRFLEKCNVWVILFVNPNWRRSYRWHITNCF